MIHSFFFRALGAVIFASWILSVLTFIGVASFGKAVNSKGENSLDFPMRWLSVSSMLALGYIGGSLIVLFLWGKP